MSVAPVRAFGPQTFPAGNVNRTGPGGGLVGRMQQLGVSTHALLGTETMKALYAAYEDRLRLFLSQPLEAEIRFAATDGGDAPQGGVKTNMNAPRTAAQNAVIGLTHARQKKSLEFQLRAANAVRRERGKDGVFGVKENDGKRTFVSSAGLSALPVRNPWYMTDAERRLYRNALRDALRLAVNRNDYSIWREGFFAAARGQIEAYHRHLDLPRLLKTSPRFVNVDNSGSATPLSEDYKRWKDRAYPGRPILTASGQLRKSIVLLRTKG